ncbi:unnamed protein product [Ectocarpus sp. 12 AP-2014]
MKIDFLSQSKRLNRFWRLKTKRVSTVKSVQKKNYPGNSVHIDRLLVPQWCSLTFDKQVGMPHKEKQRPARFREIHNCGRLTSWWSVVAQHSPTRRFMYEQ